MTTNETLANIRSNWQSIASPQMECFLLVQRVARLLRENAQSSIAPLGLSFTEFEVLAALRACAPPHSLLPTELYEAMLISSGGLTKVLKALEAEKLIARPEHSGDKRQRPVALLAKGKKLAEEGIRLISNADKLAVTSADVRGCEYRQVAEVLLRLASAMETDQTA